MTKHLPTSYRQFSFSRQHFFAKCFSSKCLLIVILLVFFFAGNKTGEWRILLKNVGVKFNSAASSYEVETLSDRNNKSKINGVEKFNISHHALPQNQLDGVSKQLTIVI